MLKPVKFKAVLAATALFALAGSSYVYAQQGFGGFGRHGSYGDGPRAGFRHRPSVADVTAFSDARIAGLKAGLELTPDQAKNWPPFEQAVRDMVQLRIQRLQARQAAQQEADQQTPASPFDRLSRRADNMSQTSAVLKKIADAGAPLYQSLNDDQKGRFMALAHILRPHHRKDGGNGNNGGWRQGEGNGSEGHGWNRGGEGPGWGHGGRRFGQENGGPGGRMQNLMNDDADQGSQL